MKSFISRTIVLLIAFTFIMGGALQFTNIDYRTPPKMIISITFLVSTIQWEDHSEPC